MLVPMSNVAAPPRKPNARSRQKREAIARAVLELVDEMGHERVTTSLVAERSGVAEATLLYHFPTKDHLLIAAQLLVDDETVAASVEGGTVSSETPFSAASLRGFDLVDDNRMRLYFMIKGMSSMPDHPAHAYFTARIERQVAMFSALVRGRIADGAAHPDLDAVSAARQIVALWEGLGAMWMCDPTFSVGELLEAGVRRIIGENVMTLRHLVTAPGSGL